MIDSLPDTRILDPRVELIAGFIHRHTEKHSGTRLDHDGMYELAITALEALESDDCLREPFNGSLVEPPTSRFRVGTFVARDLADRRTDRGMVTNVIREVKSSIVHVQFEAGHKGTWTVADGAETDLRPLRSTELT